MGTRMTIKNQGMMRSSFFTLLPLLFILSWNTSCNNEVATQVTAEPKDSTVATVTDGVLEIQIPDGGVMKGEVRNGVRQGPWISYFANGTIRSRGTYVDGEMDGPTEVYHPNGMPLYTGQYRLGLSVGEWRFYDQDGVLIKTAIHDSTGALLEQR